MSTTARAFAVPRVPRMEAGWPPEPARLEPGALADAAEAEAFIRHLLRLADDALAALDADDIERALAAVDARAACLQAVAAPLGRLAARRPPTPGAPRAPDPEGSGDLASHVTQLFDLAEALRASDAELTRRLQARRDGVAAELDRLGDASTASGGYRTAAEPARLNLHG